MDDSEEIEVAQADPPRWSWITFWSIIVHAVGGCFALAAHTVASVSEAMDAHVEWKNTRKAFEDRATLEIEALTRAPAPLVGVARDSG